jgi:hypothetical protein
VAVGAERAGDDIADAHAIAHLRDRAFLMRAEHFERAVLILRRLRRQLDRSRLLDEMLLPRRVAERAPGRHAAPFADARIRIDPRRDGELAGARFMAIRLAHGLLLRGALRRPLIAFKLQIVMGLMSQRSGAKCFANHEPVCAHARPTEGRSLVS